MWGKNRSCVPIVPDTFEEIETLPESQLCRIFPEYHIVTTTRRDEYNRRNVVEALYPFSSLITLTTDVEHTVKARESSIKYVTAASRTASNDLIAAPFRIVRRNNTNITKS